MHIQSNTLKKQYTIITPEQCALRMYSNNWSSLPITLSDHRNWSSNRQFYEGIKTKPILEKAQELDWSENSFILNFDELNSVVDGIQCVNKAFHYQGASLPEKLIVYFGKKQLDNVALESFKEFMVHFKRYPAKINVCFHSMILSSEFFVLMNELFKNGLLPSDLTLDFSLKYHDFSPMLEGLASGNRPERLTLNLSNCRLRDFEFQHLFEAIGTVKNKISVNLSNTGVKNVKSIADCIASGCLKMVDLSYNNLDDEVIFAFSKALKSKTCDPEVHIKLNILNGKLRNCANELADLLFSESEASRLHLEFQMHHLLTGFQFDTAFEAAIAGKKLRDGLQLTLDLSTLKYFNKLGVFEKGLPNSLTINAEYEIMEDEFISFKDFLLSKQDNNVSIIVNFKHPHGYELEEIIRLVSELNNSQNTHFASILFNVPEYAQVSGWVGREKIAKLDSELLTYNLFAERARYGNRVIADNKHSTTTDTLLLNSNNSTP